jgi:addiction module HigA family antidote
MRPVHPDEVLREDFLAPLSMSVNALAKALGVPTPRINDVARASGHFARYCHAAGALLWRRCMVLC